MNVPRPVIPPRMAGLPRPVSSPVSDRPSEKAIEIPAPIEVARPATKAKNGLWLMSATEKIGASVEREPSISPTMAGCARWSRKSCSSPATHRVYQAICKLCRA